MKNSKSVVLGVVILSLATMLPASASFTFQPSDPDLNDLNHHRYYIWVIDSPDAVTANPDTITGASLMFDNINDWIVEDGDMLYIRLLSEADISSAVSALSMSPYAGGDLYLGYDSQAAGDALAGYGTELKPPSPWSDVGPGPEDLHYSFNTSQLDLLKNLIAADDGFGIGIDPDCHYYNDGVKLTIESTIPAPGTISLGSIGIGLVAWLRRRRTL